MTPETPIDNEKKLGDVAEAQLDANGAIEVLHEYTAEESRALVRKFDIHVSSSLGLACRTGTDVRSSPSCSLRTCSTRLIGTTFPTRSRTA